MNKHYAIKSGELRLWKNAGGKFILVLVLHAEMSEVNNVFTGWWWVLGNPGDGFKRYLAPSHSLFNLVQENASRK